jgi:hypothetical protein
MQELATFLEQEQGTFLKHIRSLQVFSEFVLFIL